MAEFFIVGQKALDMLRRDVKMNTVRQGYIFEGSDGIGKKTVARLFAQMIFCTEENKPCGKCHGCSMFNAGSHPDFFVLEESPVKIDSVRIFSSMNHETVKLYKCDINIVFSLTTKHLQCHRLLSST